MTEIILSSDEHSNLFDKTKTCFTETKRQNITMKQEIRLGTTKKNQEILCKIRICLHGDNRCSNPRKEQNFNSRSSEKHLELSNLKLDFTE